jgi:hypothetical protein
MLVVEMLLQFLECTEIFNTLMQHGILEYCGYVDES